MPDSTSASGPIESTPCMEWEHPVGRVGAYMRPKGIGAYSRPDGSSKVGRVGGQSGSKEDPSQMELLTMHRRGIPVG